MYFLQVSLASRMVPSPDWIIGIDSLNLCVEGRWVDLLSVEVLVIFHISSTIRGVRARYTIFLQLDPLDVGTDKGFTFTSPNWPQEPPVPISVLTPTNPDHPASSFHYPGISELPKIASLRIRKVYMPSS